MFEEDKDFDHDDEEEDEKRGSEKDERRSSGERNNLNPPSSQAQAPSEASFNPMAQRPNPNEDHGSTGGESDNTAENLQGRILFTHQRSEAFLKKGFNIDYEIDILN